MITNTAHYQLLTKYFLAEGAACNHSVLVSAVAGDGDDGEKALVTGLPSVHVSRTYAEKEQNNEV